MDDLVERYDRYRPHKAKEDDVHKFQQTPVYRYVADWAWANNVGLQAPPNPRLGRDVWAAEFKNWKCFVNQMYLQLVSGSVCYSLGFNR